MALYYRHFGRRAAKGLGALATTAANFAFNQAKRELTNQAAQQVRKATKSAVNSVLSTARQSSAMPRRSNKRRSFSRKKKSMRKRKKRRVKRGTGCFKVRTRPQKAYYRIPGPQHPKYVTVRLRSVFTVVLEPPTYVDVNTDNITFKTLHMNDPEQPDPLDPNTKCYGFDEYAAKYGRWRPMASAIRVTPINNDNEINGNGGKLTPWYGINGHQNHTEYAVMPTQSSELVYQMDAGTITKWRELSKERAGTKSNVLTECWKDQTTRHLLSKDVQEMWMQTGSVTGELLQTPHGLSRDYHAHIWVGSPVSTQLGDNSAGHAFLVEYECEVAFKEPVSDVVPS